MNKKLKNLLKYLFFLTLLVDFGCNNSGSSPVNKIGTSDSGGGNGIENKVYEAYIINPQSLPAYKKYIEPKINEIQRLSGQESISSVLKKWFFYKYWVLAPVELNTLSKETLGVSFSNDNTVQFAIQTKKSIWIDSRKFDLMSEKDQAALIIHEMVMSLYFLKYKSWIQMCDEDLWDNGECDRTDIQTLAVLNEIFPANEPQPLNSNDYENIRSVTGIFLEDLNFTSLAEIDKILINNNFDRRFTPSLGLSENQEQQQYQFNFEIKPNNLEQVQELLSTMGLLNRTPDTCVGYFTKSQVACEMSFAEGTRFYYPDYIKNLNFSVKAQNNNLLTPSDFEMFSSPNTLISSVTSIPLLGKKIYKYGMFPSKSIEPLYAGKSFKSAILVAIQNLEPENAPITFLGLIIVPGIYTNIENCRYAQPSPTGLDNDIVFLHSKNLTTPDLNILKSRVSGASLVSLCNL